MPDAPTSNGILAAIAAATIAASGALTAFFSNRSERKEKRQADRQEYSSNADLAAERRVLAQANKDTIEGLRTENDRLRVENERRQKAADLWERRARRADQGWHKERHDRDFERQFPQRATATMEQIPLLEDPM